MASPFAFLVSQFDLLAVRRSVYMRLRLLTCGCEGNAGAYSGNGRRALRTALPVCSKGSGAAQQNSWFRVRLSKKDETLPRCGFDVGCGPAAS